MSTGLTAGREVRNRRRIGGRRAVLRREAKKAKDRGDAKTANQLSSELARENLRREAAGQSNITSADEEHKRLRRLAQDASVARGAKVDTIAENEGDGNLPRSEADAGEGGSPYGFGSAGAITPPGGGESPPVPGGTPKPTPTPPGSPPSSEVVEGSKPKGEKPGGGGTAPSPYGGAGTGNPPLVTSGGVTGRGLPPDAEIYEDDEGRLFTDPELKTPYRFSPTRPQRRTDYTKPRYIGGLWEGGEQPPLMEYITPDRRQGPTDPATGMPLTAEEVRKIQDFEINPTPPRDPYESGPYGIPSEATVARAQTIADARAVRNIMDTEGRAQAIEDARAGRVSGTPVLAARNIAQQVLTEALANKEIPDFNRDERLKDVFGPGAPLAEETKRYRDHYLQRFQDVHGTEQFVDEEGKVQTRETDAYLDALRERVDANRLARRQEDVEQTARTGVKRRSGLASTPGFYVGRDPETGELKDPGLLSSVVNRAFYGDDEQSRLGYAERVFREATADTAAGASAEGSRQRQILREVADRGQSPIGKADDETLSSVVRSDKFDQWWSQFPSQARDPEEAAELQRIADETNPTTPSQDDTEPDQAPMLDRLEREDKPVRSGPVEAATEGPPLGRIPGYPETVYDKDSHLTSPNPLTIQFGLGGRKLPPIERVMRKYGYGHNQPTTKESEEKLDDLERRYRRILGERQSEVEQTKEEKSRVVSRRRIK